MKDRTTEPRTKLTLSRETIRTLTSADLSRVVGATGHTHTCPVASCTCVDPTGLDRP